MQKYPEVYTLQEIMSIMGGKFHTQLTFKLEKNLLAMVIPYVHILGLWVFLSKITSELCYARISNFCNYY